MSQSPPPESPPPESVPPESIPSAPDAIEPTLPDMPSVSLGPHFEMHPRVFPAGALIVLALVALTFFFPQKDVLDVFENAKQWIGQTFGWLYVASLTGMLVFAIWLAVGRFGKLKLGSDDEKPEFSTISWFAMLFSAGMGIGLVFWSVAEPIYHYNSDLPGLGHGLDAARTAMAVTIFHWGLHPWALYAVVGLSLAYFGFRRKMPLSFRSMLHPLLGDRVWGLTGDVVDVLAIIATLTGVATSLGLGAQQVNAGMSFLFGTPMGAPLQVIIIAGITAVATVSVVLGLSVGIRRLSEANLVLAALLMIMVVFGGGLFLFLSSSVENTGAYLQLLPFSSFRTGAFNEDGRGWVNAWTVFYWAWWISWSPFVGMFIARISRGRTIREFVTGVIIVPTLVGILWLTAFGTTTLREHEQHMADADDTSYVAADHLPSYTLQRQAEGGFFAVAEDGRLVGPSGVAYKPINETTLLAPDGTRVQLGTAEGSRKLIVAGEGNAYSPPEDLLFEGKYAGDEQPLTAVQYLSSPVLTADRTQRIDRTSTVLFALLDGLFAQQWIAFVAAGAATLCIVLFFVTSSDSASMVIDIIASGGNPDPPVGTRLFWAITEGVVAAALLLIGGLKALQAASITAALPFTFILLLTCVSLIKGLYHYERVAPQEA